MGLTEILTSEDFTLNCQSDVPPPWLRMKTNTYHKPAEATYGGRFLDNTTKWTIHIMFCWWIFFHLFNYILTVAGTSMLLKNRIFNASVIPLERGCLRSSGTWDLLWPLVCMDYSPCAITLCLFTITLLTTFYLQIYSSFAIVPALSSPVRRLILEFLVFECQTPCG